MSIDVTDHVRREQLFGDVCDSAGRLQRNLSLLAFIELPTVDIRRPIKENIDIARDRCQKASSSQRQSLLMISTQDGCEKVRRGANAGKGCHLVGQFALPLHK